MRIAALSDIHGNVWALDAVLADVRRRGVDLIVNLGDILSGALRPVETADRLMALSLPTISGNHERQVLRFARADMRLSDKYAAELLRPDQLQWIDSLPATLSLSPEVLLVHGTPRSDLEYFLHSVDIAGLRAATMSELMERAGSRKSEVILCGHTHLPGAVHLPDGRLIVNPGSVGIQAFEDDAPFAHVVETGTPDARYAIIERCSAGRWIAELIEVEYDVREAVAAAAATGRQDWVRAISTGRVTADA